MSPVKNVVIAAAGLGSRLGMGMPKCMIHIGHEPIIARMLRMLSKYVDTIVVVAGYREELISEYCQIHFREVVIARNPEYATTNTAQSLSLGARFVRGKTLFLDGDLLLESQTLGRFIELAEGSDLLLGVTHARTDQPVYADCEGDAVGYLTINTFSRDKPTPYEWANLFVGPHNIMDGAEHYVFERLAEGLPLSAALIDIEEIDTPQDMERAKVAVESWGG